MIYYVDIGGKEHPFKFGMRVMYEFKAKYSHVDPQEVMRLIDSDFDALVCMFALANQNGCRAVKRETGKKPKALSYDAIEEALDNGGKFMEMMELLGSMFPDEQDEAKGTKAGKKTA